MNKLFAFAALLLFSASISAQNLTGRVIDAKSKEPLIGASVLIENQNKGTSTNAYGYFSIGNLEAGKASVTVSYVGYESQTLEATVPNTDLIIELQPQQELLDPVNINAVRASKDVPIAKSNLGKKELEQRDEGRDIPFILRDLPSTVVNSDAGAGIGYTGIRIRGSDITRINVTVNGIPINDPESHGVFWVNTPDLVSSTNSIQVQRGVGTSTNGAGAFGASINLKTSRVSTKPFAKSELTAGSFNTFKRNLQAGTGLMGGHWVVEGRVSEITSDGFIDRARSDLNSYYLSGSYYSENTSVQLIHFGGGEETYQAWWGIPEAKLFGTDAELQNHIARNGYSPKDSANLVDSDPRTYNYYTYENEVDNYKQDHWQLHISQRFTDQLKANLALHHTYGRGYFEQYRNGDHFSTYGLSPVINGNDTITSTDLIRRRWLDNTFAGLTYSFEYDNESGLNLILGGAYNQYNGDHFGNIQWARFASNSEIRDRYYDNTSTKGDFNTYLKALYQWKKFTFFGDLQVRRVSYTGSGLDNDQFIIDIDTAYTFFNPKGGLNYQLSQNSRVYASVAVAQREPVRNDFLDAPSGNLPSSELLIDYEAGYDFQSEKALFQANLFFMDYYDQLVLTGQVNDVGSAIRENVERSYRAGIELQGGYRFNNMLQLNANVTISENRILDYTNYIVNYDNGQIESENIGATHISFSPGLIAGAGFTATPFDNFNIIWQSKYVSEQYLDNTSSAEFLALDADESKKLDAFWVTDLRLTYDLKAKGFKNIQFHLLVANLFDHEYEPNGYTFSYIAGGQTITENFYYPMAGINFLGGIKVELF